MPKVLSIGHITLDTFLKVEDVEMHCDVNHEDCKISFGFGSKIPVKEVFYSPGGGSANTAVGLQKLGHEVWMLSIIGNDSKGADILANLAGNEINTSYIEQDSNPTDQSAVITYGIERTIFTYSYPRKYSMKNVNEEFSAIYLSSIGIDVGQLYKEVIHLKKNGKFRDLFYNPGAREIKHARDDMAELLKHVDHLIVNVEEGCAILNLGLKRSDIDIGDLMSLLNDKGPENIVLTDGDKGSYVWAEKEMRHYPAIKTEVVEKTGAGDAYASGYMASILYGYDSDRAARMGVNNSSNVIRSFGAQNGLLTKKDLIKSLGDIPLV